MTIGDKDRGEGGRVPVFVFLLLAIPFTVLLVFVPWGRLRGGPSREFTNSIGMKFVRVEPGEFWMGSPESEAGRFSDETRHKVKLTKGFFLGVHEVTKGEFAAFAEATGHRTDAEKEGKAWGWDGKEFGEMAGASWKTPGFDQTRDHPVVDVSWNDATAFCEWLAGKEGKKYRLPTEAEWEYACRAGTETAYPWGEDPENGAGWTNVADETAKEKFGPNWETFKWRDGYAFTAPVGRFKANAWGLTDMIGNVWEWCGDRYGEYGAGEATDPKGLSIGGARVLRGGSWDIAPRASRSALRFRYSPGYRIFNLGFRAAVDF